MGAAGYIHRLHGPGVQASVIHHRGERRGSGVEILDLLRHIAHVPDKFRQLHRLAKGRAGVGGHEVGHQVLLQMVLLIQGKIPGGKLLVNGVFGLTHFGQNGVRHVLRGHLQLAGYVVLHQLPEEGIPLVRQDVVKANAAADEDLLHPRQLPELAQEAEIVAVVRPEVGAGGGEETLPPGADAFGQLLVTGRGPEVSGGASYIVDVTLEIRVMGHLLGLSQNGVVAAGLDDPPLVEGEGAEGAGSEAAPVGHQAELHFLDGGDAPGFPVAGMVIPAVGEVINPIHFRLGQGLLGWILHHKFPPIGLSQPSGCKGVRIAVLDTKAFGILPGAFPERFEVRQDQGGQAVVQGPGPVNSAVDVGHVLNGKAAVQAIRHFPDAPLSHAVEEQVRLGVQQDGTAHLVRPVIVMGQPPETGLHAANENRYIPEALADQVAVYNGSPVRPLSHHSAGGKSIGFPAVMGYGIVVYHGVHIAPGDQKAQPGPPQGADGLRVLPVRLGEDPHLVSCRLQDPADDGVSKGRVIHIGVANDIDKVTLLPSPGRHIRPGDRQKFRHKNASHFKFSPSVYQKSPQKKSPGSLPAWRRGAPAPVGRNQVVRVA